MAEVTTLTLDEFLDGKPATAHPILFVENSPESRKVIDRVREKARPSYLVWFGRGFTKEDLIYAMENRVIEVFENPRPDDQSLAGRLHKVVAHVERQQEFSQVIHALKSTLLQKEQDAEDHSFVNELKTAVAKLERSGTSDFSQRRTFQPKDEESAIPFYKAQEFGDALATVHELERTGGLIVSGSLPEQEGTIQFLQGKIVAAQVGQVSGLKAIYRMFLWDEPKYIFTRQNPDDFEISEPITLGMKYIRAEGEAFRGRYGSIRRELPPGELKLALEPASLHPGTDLTRPEFETLSSVVELSQVGLVLDFNPLPDVTIYEALIGLKRKSMVRVVS